MPLFFWFDLSSEASAEISEIFSLLFWDKRLFHKDILKLSDLYNIWVYHKVALNEASTKFGHKTIRKFASETFSTIDFIELESRENPETVTSRASRIFFID